MFSALLIAALVSAPLASGPGRDGVGQANGEQRSSPPISTDRPTESLSPGVVPRHSFQIESGWKLSRATDAGVRTDTNSVPDAVFRFGLTDRLELRAGVTGWEFRSLSETGRADGARNENGFTDINAGFKLSIADQLGARPAVSLLADVNLPVGNAGFTNDYANPQVWLLFANDLSDRLAIVYNVGPQFTTLKQDSGSTRTVVDLEYVATLAGVASERVGLFAEVFGSLPLSDGRSDTHTLQAGVTFLSSNNTQLDARAGIGLVEDASDWLVGVGFSIRLPR